MKPEPVKLPPSGSQRKSPTELTLQFLRRRGYICGIVERRNPKIANMTHDLFGIIDIIALTADGVMGVQSTGEAFAAHWRKLTVTKAKASARWLAVPGTHLMLIGWHKIKDSNGESRRMPRIRMIDTWDLLPALNEQDVGSGELILGRVFEANTLKKQQ